jgi:hypothetical protein
MPESISTFKQLARWALPLALAWAIAGACLPLARADNGLQAPGSGNPEEDDFKSTPYMQYGEFNEEKEEEEDTNFFQNGRFFGVSLGVGVETADGNRGTIWKGGFPTFDLKLHYWFDFNFALDLNFYYAQHNYDTANTGAYNVNLIRAGVDVKYYFDTKNISAPISFANPYLVAGVGNYTETETAGNVTNASASEIPASTSALGLCAGAGLEFALKPKKVYFSLEGKIHFVRFDFDNTGIFQPFVDNTNGNLYTFVASVLFTW